MQKVGVNIRVTCWASILSLKNPLTKQKRKFVIRDSARKEFLIPEGWKSYYESHLVGSIEQYPKLQTLLGDKPFVVLPEKKHLWYDR